jgi:GxxExxY protein
MENLSGRLRHRDAGMAGHTERLLKQVIGAGMTVSNTLGAGYLEAVYRRALAVELIRSGISVDQERPFRVMYRGEMVGSYQADLVISEQVIVETKVCEGLTDAHVGQLLNYLKCSGLRAGLLMNFGKPRMQFRRVVF